MLAWKKYINAATVDEVLALLAEGDGKTRLVAGATDLILEMERGVRKGIETLVDITRIPGLDNIILDEDEIIHLGALVTHGQCAASRLLIQRGFPLARAAWEVGAPQIRTRGTIAGNLITASPANDTITPLMALGGQVTLASVQGERSVPLSEFYTGVRRTVMRPDEMLVDISFPALQPNQAGSFYKLGLRRAQAISVVDAAVVLTMQGQIVEKASITLGSVAPTIVHALQAEAYLAGKRLDMETIEAVSRLAQQAAHPIDDVRGSGDYRLEMTRVCVLRLLRSLALGNERQGYPERPVQLRIDNGIEQANGSSAGRWDAQAGLAPIITRINGKEYTFTTGQHKTLLNLLRDEAGLIGTKEGCAEGECGACTVYLDGMAVMSCLVPAPRAHGAEIMTVEGLAHGSQLHPVQQAFIDQAAVQCGYCTPGFLMSAAMLLDEVPNPSQADIKQAISGNLCRCTGYYSIVAAIEQAAEQLASNRR